MKLKVNNGIIDFEDEENSFAISKTVDGDIWFSSGKSNITQTISSKARDIGEWQSYEIFAKLVRQIIGNFILEDDKDNIRLPKDFVDLENKIITWHSDSGTDNVLELLHEDKSIIISITKDKKASSNVNNSVRVRTDGSSYEYYYHFFTQFHAELMQLANIVSLNEIQAKIEIESQSEEKTSQKKKRFGFFGKNNSQ
jgi:hypothetical protein